MKIMEFIVVFGVVFFTFFLCSKYLILVCLIEFYSVFFGLLLVFPHSLTLHVRSLEEPPSSLTPPNPLHWSSFSLRVLSLGLDVGPFFKE